MNKFLELCQPYEVLVMGVEGYYVHSYVGGMYLHDNRTLQHSLDRVTKEGRTVAMFESEDDAYLAINDYYLAHGEHTPYIRLGSNWHNAKENQKGQTTEWLNGGMPEKCEETVESQVMEFV